ncbi:enoyl-CoA hydratase/isomerase family protein, partial [Streptomyces sp. NPDC005904]
YETGLVSELTAPGGARAAAVGGGAVNATQPPPAGAGVTAAPIRRSAHTPSVGRAQSAIGR